MSKLLYGVGYIGVGPFLSYELVDGKERKARLYRCWQHMLERCYGNNPKWMNTYTGCTVSSRWHNFQNFAADITKMAGYDLEGWQLDKDILKPGNRIYSRNTCCFVPPVINMAFTGGTGKRNGNRKVNTNLPQGVNTTPKGNYVARLAIVGRQPHIGTFDTVEEARDAYLKTKRAYLRELARKFKGDLDPKVYKALMRWRPDA